MDTCGDGLWGQLRNAHPPVAMRVRRLRNTRSSAAAVQGNGGTATESHPNRWWGIAAIRANPLTERKQAQLARDRAGDFTGLHARDERGNWTTL